MTQEELLRHVAELNAENERLRERLRAAEDQSDWMGGSLKARTRLLDERLKELNCVHETVRTLRHQALSREQRVAKVLEILPKAWQFPKDAGACIVLGEREFRGPGFDASGGLLQEPIVRGTGQVGRVEVGYRRPHPFLDEEKELLSTVAECLGALLD